MQDQRLAAVLDTAFPFHAAHRRPRFDDLGLAPLPQAEAGEVAGSLFEGERAGAVGEGIGREADLHGQGSGLIEVREPRPPARAHFSASSTTPSVTSAMPDHSRSDGRSPSSSTANSATSTTENLSTGATLEASPIFSARK